MHIRTPVTKERLKTHFTYSLWKYAVVIACSLFCWSLVYAQTAYRSPQDKRIDVYVKSSTVTEELMDSFFEPIWQSVVPDMELVSGVTLLSTSDDTDYYSQMQLTVYIAAGEGDIYILPAGDFKSFAASGAFISLDDLVADGTIDVTGIDTSSGRVTIVDEDAGTSETHLYGIPLDSLYGFIDGMQLDNRGMVAAIMVNNQNDENVIPFFNALIQAGRGDAPEWLEESETDTAQTENTDADTATESAETDTAETTEETHE